MTTYVCARQAVSGFNGRDFAAITAEFQVDPTRRNECVELMRDVRMIFLRSGDNRWHLYENLTQPNKFRMEIVVPAGDGAWLKTNSNTVALALNLVPFARIAFYGSSASCVTRLEGWHDQPYRVATCRIHGSQPITSTQLFRSAASETLGIPVEKLGSDSVRPDFGLMNGFWLLRFSRTLLI